MKLIKNIKNLILVFLCTIVSFIGFSFAILFGNTQFSSCTAAVSNGMVLANGSAKTANILDNIKQNPWIWIIVGISGLLFLVLVIVFIKVCSKQKKEDVEEETITQPSKSQELNDIKAAVTTPQELNDIKAPVTTSQDNNDNKAQVTYAQEPNKNNTQVTDLLLAQLAQPQTRQTSYDPLLAILLNSQQDIQDIKVKLAVREKLEEKERHEAELKQLREELQKSYKITEEFFRQQKEEKQKDKIGLQQKEIDKINYEALIEEIVKRFSEKNKTESSQLNPEDKIELLEELVHKKTQQIPEIAEVEKKIVIEKPVIVEREIEIEKPVIVERPIEIEKPVIVEKPVEVEKQVVKLADLTNSNVVEKKSEQRENLDDFDLDFDDNDDGEHISDDATASESAPKLTLEEEYALLSMRQKSYFEALKRYASAKPKARLKKAKSYLSIGIGNKNYVQLTIKRNTVVACFCLESEEMQKLRLGGETSVKPQKTKVKVVNNETLETAMKMIDVRVEQVAREIELTNERRKEKQKQLYKDKKKA